MTMESSGKGQVEAEVANALRMETSYARISLLGIPPEMFQTIYKFLDTGSRLRLRLVCRLVLARCQASERRLLRQWKLNVVTGARLEDFSDQVRVVEELSIAELQGDQQEVEDGLRTLLHNHSEIRAIQILNSSCSEIAFRMILASPHMTSLSLRHCRLALPAEGGNGIVEADDLVGETLENEGILSRLPVLAPLQSLDLSYCTKYSIRLNMIASRINTSHLKILNLSHTCASLIRLESEEVRFPVLEELILNNCKSLSNRGFHSLLRQSKTTLKKLCLESTYLDLRIPDLDQLPCIQELNFRSFMPVADSSPLDFAVLGASTLKKLNLGSVMFVLRLDCLPNLSNLTALEELDLRGWRSLDAPGFVQLVNPAAASLRKLHISSTQLRFGPADLAALPAVLPRLEVLSMGQFSSEQNARAFLARVATPRLSELDLSMNGIRYTNLVPVLARVGGTLTKLNLAFNLMENEGDFAEAGADAAMAAAAAAALTPPLPPLPGLESIDLTCCPFVGDKLLEQILARTRASLKRLHISGTRVELRLTDEAALEAVGGGPRLESLFMLGLHSAVGEAEFFDFINRFSGSLRHLRIGATTELTLCEVDRMADNFPELEHLDFIICESVLVSSIITMLNKTGSTLKRLSLGNIHLRKENLDSITTSCPLLEELNIINNKIMSNQFLILLLTKIGGNLKKLFTKGTTVIKSVIQASFPKLMIVET